MCKLKRKIHLKIYTTQLETQFYLLIFLQMNRVFTVIHTVHPYIDCTTHCVCAGSQVTQCGGGVHPGIQFQSVTVPTQSQITHTHSHLEPSGRMLATNQHKQRGLASSQGGGVRHCQDGDSEAAHF